MDTKEALKIIKDTFSHLVFEENITVEGVKTPLYFPTINIVVLERKQSDGIEKIKELSADVIFLDTENFSIGHIINDILLTAEFVPGRYKSARD